MPSGGFGVSAALDLSRSPHTLVHYRREVLETIPCWRRGHMMEMFIGKAFQCIEGFGKAMTTVQDTFNTQSLILAEV